jgi:DNA-binding CsgD family transcriptional regulator
MACYQLGDSLVLPHVKIEAVGHGLDAVFGAALPLANAVNPKAPEEGLYACRRVADVAHLVDFEAKDPLAWRFSAAVGVERLNGGSRSGTACMGDHVDQSFARGVLIPSYFDVLKANQPVVHRVAGVSNGTFLNYRRLGVPLFTASRHRPSHLIVLTILDFAVPDFQRRPPGETNLTPRERQCLSLAAGGLGSQRVAHDLGISEKMVEMHLAHARRKLGARTTSQAIAIALTSAWLDHMTP